MLLQKAQFHYFLWLSNILMYRYIHTTSLYPFIYDGNLSSFHILAMVNNAAKTLRCILLLLLSLFKLSDSVSLRTAAHQAPLSLEFTKQEYTGVGCHALLQGIFPTQIKSMFPALQADSLPLSHKGSPIEVHMSFQISLSFSLDIHPKEDLLNHMIVLFSVFWKISILFFVKSITIYISTKVFFFFFPTSWKILIICCCLMVFFLTN